MSIKKFTVARDNSVYQAWPDLVQTDSGELICVFSECTTHTDRTGARLVICRSADRGRSWSEKLQLTDKCKKDDFFNCPRISKLIDGRLAIICDRVQGNLGEHKKQLVQQYVWFSDDNGINWSEPVVLPFCGIVPDKLKQLRNGRLIVSAHFQNFTTEKLEQYLWYSDNNGKSWSDRIIVASNPLYNLCEASILECENNTLIAFMRENSFMGYDMMKAISYDNGESWNGIYNTPVACGHRPTANFLADGNILITYRFLPTVTPPLSFSNQNIFASVLYSEDLLKTARNEQKIRTMPIDYDRNFRPDCGYTGWTQFDDGEIYVVSYIKDDAQKAYIRGYSFYPNDIVLTEDDK